MAYTLEDHLKESISPPTPPTPLQSGAGLAILLVGLIGAISSPALKYNRVTKGSRQAISAIPSQFESDIKGIETGYDTAISGSRAANEAETMQSAQARGLSSEVGKESISKQAVGLSGAYAAAHNALQRAKVNASNALSASMGTYYQNLQDKQVEAQSKEYLAKMGIWSALGGIGGDMLKRGV